MVWVSGCGGVGCLVRWGRGGVDGGRGVVRLREVDGCVRGVEMGWWMWGEMWWEMKGEVWRMRCRWKHLFWKIDFEKKPILHCFRIT